MSGARDLATYVEATGAKRDGAELFAVQNLTLQDVAVINEELTRRRTRNTIVVSEGKPDAPKLIVQHLHRESERLDELCTSLRTIVRHT